MISWKVDTQKISTSCATLITVTIVAYVAKRLNPKRKSCFIVKPNTLSLLVNGIFYICCQNYCKAIKKRVRHYYCLTCNKALQKLKFLSHLKNCFYIDSEEKVNDEEELLSSTPLESSVNIWNLESLNVLANFKIRGIWKKERTLLNI